MSGKSIAFVIEKGGTGKSTIAFNVGWALSQRSKVLFVDLDGQMANLTYFCGVSKDSISTVASVLDAESSLNESVVNVKKNLDILPGDNSLMSLGSQQHYQKISRQDRFREFAENNPQLSRSNAYQLFLIEEMQKLIKKACEGYDYVLLDPNPSPNYLHTLSLCASRYVIIPVLPDAASIISDEGTAESISIIRENELNEDLAVLGILFNRYTARTNLSKQVRELIEEYSKEMDTSVFDSTIRNSVVLSECVGMHIGITDYRPKSPAAEDIKAVVSEIKRRIKKCQ